MYSNNIISIFALNTFFMPDPIVPAFTSFEEFEKFNRQNPNQQITPQGASTSRGGQYSDFKSGNSAFSVDAYTRKRKEEVARAALEEEMARQEEEQEKIAIATAKHQKEKIEQERLALEGLREEYATQEAQKLVEKKEALDAGESIDKIDIVERQNRYENQLKNYKKLVTDNPDAFNEESKTIQEVEQLLLEKKSEGISPDWYEGFYGPFSPEMWSSIKGVGKTINEAFSSSPTNTGIKAAIDAYTNSNSTTGKEIGAINSTLNFVTEAITSPFNTLANFGDANKAQKALESLPQEKQDRYNQARETLRKVNSPVIYSEIKKWDEIIGDLLKERKEREYSIESSDYYRLNSALHKARTSRKRLKDLYEDNTDLSLSTIYKEQFANNILDVSSIFYSDKIEGNGQYLLFPNINSQIAELAHGGSMMGRTLTEKVEDYKKKNNITEMTEEDYKNLQSGMSNVDALLLETEIGDSNAKQYVDQLGSFSYKTQIAAADSFGMIMSFAGGSRISKGIFSGLRRVKYGKNALRVTKEVQKRLDLIAARNMLGASSRFAKPLGAGLNMGRRLAKEATSVVASGVIDPTFINEEIKSKGLGWIRNNEGAIIAGLGGRAYVDYNIDLLKKQKKDHENFVDSVGNPESLTGDKRDAYEKSLVLLGRKQKQKEEDYTFDEMLENYELADTAVISDVLRGFVQIGTEKFAEIYTSKALKGTGNLISKGLGKNSKVKYLTDKLRETRLTYNSSSLGSLHKEFNNISRKLFKVDGQQVINSYPTEVVEEYIAEGMQSLISFTRSGKEGRDSLKQFGKMAFGSTDFAVDVVAQTALTKGIFGGMGASGVAGGYMHSRIRSFKMKQREATIRDLNNKLASEQNPDVRKKIQANLNRVKKLQKSSLENKTIFGKTNMVGRAIGASSDAVKARIDNMNAMDSLLKSLNKSGSLDQDTIDKLSLLDGTLTSNSEFSREIKELEKRGKHKEAAELKNMRMHTLIDNAIKTDSVKDLKASLSQSLNKVGSNNGSAIRAINNTIQTLEKVENHLAEFGETTRGKLGATMIVNQELYKGWIQQNKEGRALMEVETIDDEFGDFYNQGDYGDLSYSDASLILNSLDNPFSEVDQKEKYESFEKLVNDFSTQAKRTNSLGKYSASMFNENQMSISLKESARAYRQIINPTDQEVLAEKFMADNEGAFISFMKKNPKTFYKEGQLEEFLEEKFDDFGKLTTETQEILSSDYRKIVLSQKSLLDKQVKDLHQSENAQTAKDQLETDSDVVLDEADKGVSETLEETKEVISENSQTGEVNEVDKIAELESRKQEAKNNPVSEPESYAKAVDEYKQTELGGSEDAKTKKDNLVKQAQTKEGRAFVENKVAQLNYNEDGTITVYRSGTIQEGHNPATTDKKTAELISSEREKQGLSSDIVEIKVQPTDISAIVPGIESEVLIRVDKNNAKRIKENTKKEQKTKEQLLSEKTKVEEELIAIEKSLAFNKKAFAEGTYPFADSVFKDDVKKKEAKIKNLKWQLKKYNAEIAALNSKPTQQTKNTQQTQNEAVEDDPLKGMPFDTESDEMIDLGDIPRDSNPIVEKFKKDIKVIAAYFRTKGEKTSITFEDVFNMMVVNEENPGELLNMFTFASLQQAYEEIHTKAKSKSPAFRQGEIKMLENRLKKIFDKRVQNPKQEHVNLKAQTYSHVPLGTQTAKKETTSEFKAKQRQENTLGLEEQPQMVGEQKSGRIPRLGFLGLAFKRFLEKGVVITRTTDYFNLQLPDIDGRWDRVDPRPLLHPDTPNSFEVGVEIASEDSWDRIPVATEVKDEAGNPEYISFKNWVKEKESKDPNFRNTQEFFDKVPIYATMDGKKVSFIHDQDWFNGYSVSAPFENEGDSYIHPRDAMNNVSWAYHINQAKKRNGELRAKILQGKDPLRKLKVNKLQDKNVLNFIPTEESDLIPLIQANPQADLHVTTQNGRENFINNHPKLKTGEWELTNKKDSTFEGVTGHTFALFRVGSRINDKGVKVKTYQAVKLHRQFAHNPNTDSEIESVLRAFGMHTALNKKARNKISKEFEYSTESARKQNNTLGRKYNKTLSTNDGFINYFSMFFKITPKGVKKVDTELKRKKINDEYKALIKKGLSSEEAQLQAVSKVDAEYKNNRGTNYLPVAMILEEAMSITNPIKRKEFLNEHLAQTTRAVDLQQNTKVAHISDTGVQDTGQTYKDYLMTTFQTSLKAFDMSTGNEASVYSPVIQTIIEIEDESESTVNEEVTPTETEKVKPEVKPEKKTEEQHLAELQEAFSSQSTAPQGDVFIDHISGITYVANEEGQYIEVKDKAPKTEELQKEEKEERTEVLEIEQFVEDFLKTDIDSHLEEDEMITIGELEDMFQGTIAEVPYAKARSFISLIQNTLTRKSDFRDKLSNRSIKIIRAVAKRRVQLHSAPIIKKIEANLESLQQLENPTKRNLATIKALQQNLAYFKASVDSFEEFFKVALEKSVSETDIDTSDYDSSSETEEIEKNYSKESVEETVKSRATGKLKTLLSGIPQYNSKGEISYGYGGVPNYLSLDDAYNLVLKALSIGVDPKADFDYLITKLGATDNPSLNEIIKRLKNSDGQLKNQFVVNTTMHSLTSRFLMFDVDYNGKTSLKVYDTNSSTTKRAVVDRWKDNVLSTKLYDELGNFNSVHAQSLLKRFADFSMDFDEVGQGQLRKFLEDLGIEMHDKAWESILNVGVTSGTKSYNLRQMFDSTKKGEKDLSLFTKINEFLQKGINNPEDYSSIGTNIFDDISGLSSGLAQLEAEYNPELISTVFRDSGKTISTLVPPKFITDEVSKILESANGDNKYIDEITQFPYSGNSLILQALVENPEFRDYYGVNHMSLTALKDRNKRTTGEKKYNELDASETLMTALGFFQDRKTSTFSEKKEIDGIKVRMGQMMNQTMSDKSTALSSGTVIYDILSDLEEHFSMDIKSGLVTGLSDKLLSVMFDRVVSNQVLKILDMHQRTTGSTIKSYDKASTLFIDIPGLNSLQIDGVNLVEYLYNVAKDNPLGGIDENAVLEKIEEPVKALLSKIVNNEVENKIEVMQKFGVKKKGNSMIDDKYIQEHLKKPNASNPEVMKIALYDFVFNDMIFKSEMNKLFISDLALYHKHKFPEGKNIYQLSTKEYVAMSKETGVNVGKRLALLIAPGRKIASSTQKYEQIFLEDPVDISENMSYLIKLFHPDKEEKLQSLLRTYIEEPSKENYNAFEKIAPEIAGYLQLESADAQEYTTVGEHLNVMYLSGKLSEDEYNNLKTAYETGGFNSLTKEEKKIVLQPVKPVYTGIHNDVEQGVRRVVYIKSSSIPLLPELTKGTELDNLRVQMEKLEEKGNFVRASYQTANKIGASINTVDIRDPESLALINLENSGVTMTLDRSNFKIQQDVPHKSSKAKQDKVSMGTQIFKLLLGDGVLDVEGDVFPYKGKMISAEELKKNFNESFSIIYDNSYNSLLEELGFLDGQGGDNPAFNDRIFKRNLSDLLKKEAETRGYDLKSVAGLELNKQGEFEIPLWLSSDSNRFESLLNSIITNRIMQFKLPGNGFVAASENGTKFKKEFNDLSDSDKNDIIYLDGWNGVELKGTTDDNGEMKSAQIMIESKFKDSEGNLIDLFEQYNKVTKEGRYIFRDEQGILRLKEGAIDSELFNMFSFRTPTSGHVSSSSIEIVGILPSTAGDQMVVPKNFTKQKGLDFDVDKETAYMLNHYLDTDENIQAINDAYREALQDLKYEDYSIDPYIENFIFDQTNLSHTISERDVRFTGYNIPKRKRPLIYKLARIIAFEKDTTEDRKKKIEKLHKGLGELFGEDYIQDSQIIKDELIAQINLDPKQYDKVLKQLIEDFSTRKAPIDEFIKNTQKKRFSKKVAKKIETKIAENDFIRTHLAVAKSPSTEIQKKFNKILSMSYAGSQAAKIEELNNEGNEAKLLAKIAAKHKVKTGKSMSDEAQIAALEEQESLFTLLSHDYQKDKMDLGAVGKGAIGVYSVAITFASQLQQAYGKTGMNKEEFTIGNYTSTSLGAVNTINPEKEAVDYSTADMLGEKQNTSTDNEKEQILGRVGVDEISITADAHGSLRGFGKDENGNSIMYQLLSQPIVKEFNKRLKESRGLLGDFIKEEDLINEILEENGFDLVFVDIKNTDIGPAFFKRGDKKYLNPLPLGSSELTGNIMVDGIASGNTTQETQGEALKTYFELLREGRSYIGKISSLNSNELGKSAVGVRVKRNKLIRTLSDEKMIPLFGEKVEYGTPGAFSFQKEVFGRVVSVGVMPTTPQGKIAIGGILAYEKLFSGLFPFSNEAVASQLDYVLSVMNVSEEYRSDEKYEEVFREMKKYIFSRVENNIISRNPNQVRRELMVDTSENTSLSTYIKTVLKGKDRKYAKGVSALLDNALVGKKLKYIVGKNEEEVSRIVYENANSENIDERELYEALPALVINDHPLPPKNGLPYSTKELAEDLIRYSFLEGGIQEANQFMKFIPVELLSYFGRDNKSVSDAFQEVDKKKIDATFFTELLKRFPKQYFQNNPASAQKISTNKIVSNDGRILVTKFKKGEEKPIFYQVKDTKRNIQLFELIDGGPNYRRVSTMSTKRISQYNPNGEALDVRANAEENYTNSLDLIPESLKNLYESIEQGVSVKEMLESIMPLLIDEDVDKANFVEQLIKYVQDGKVIFTESVGFMSTSAAGDVKINPLVFLKKAAINPSYVLDTLLHETIHTTTTRKIREYFDVVNREYILKPGIKNVPSFVTDMIVLHNESKKAVESYILDNYDVSTEDVQAVKNMLGNRSVNVTTELKNLFPDKNQEELYKVVGLLYSVINPAEMMSNLMNDKTYFDILKNTKYKNTTDTLLDRIKEFFIEAVQNLFPDIKEGTLAKAVINNMFETMSEQYTALDKLNSQDEMIDIKKEESKEEDSGMNTGIIFRRKEFEYKIEGFKDFVDNQSDEIIDIGSENSYTFEETNSGQSVEDLIEYEDWADMTTAERNKFKECN